jgi:hypothetical protein
LNCTNDSVLSVNEFEVIEVEVTNLESFAKAERVNVNNETFGDSSVNSFNAKFLHRESQFTTGFNTFSVAFEFNGNFDSNGFSVVNFEQVDVEDRILNGVELNIFEDSHTFLAVDIELDSEDIGSVNEFTNSVLRNNEVSSDKTLTVTDFYEFFAGFKSTCKRKRYDFATVKNNGD